MGMRTWWMGGLVALATMLGGAGSAQAADTLYWSTGGSKVIDSAPLSGGTASTFVPSGAGLHGPAGLAVDATGDLIVADNDETEKVTPAGAVSTIATGPFSAENVVLDSAGRIFAAANATPAQVYEVSADGTISNYGPQLSPSVAITALTVDAAGNVYAAVSSGTIAKITPSGTSSPIASGLTSPDGLAFGPSGDLFVSEYSASEVVKISPDGTASPFLTGVPTPLGLAFDRRGDLFVSENGGSREISEWDPSGSPVRTFSTAPYNVQYDTIVQSPAPHAISVSGASTTGHALTCSGSWIPDVAGSFDFSQPTSTNYAWTRSGTPVPGATGVSFTPTTAGAYACSATGANQAGSTTETSTAVTVTQPAPPPTPSNALTVKTKKFDSRDRVQLRLQTKAAGRLSAKVTYRTTKTTYTGRGHHRRRHVRHVTNTAGTKTAAIHGAGITSVTISSRRGFSKTLAKLKTIHLSIALRFTPTGGRLRIVTTSLTIHAPKPRHKPTHHH